MKQVHLQSYIYGPSCDYLIDASLHHVPPKPSYSAPVISGTISLSTLITTYLREITQICTTCLTTFLKCIYRPFLKLCFGYENDKYTICLAFSLHQACIN